MSLQNLSGEINRLSENIEEIFMAFSTEFPKMLTVTHSSSLDELMSALSTLRVENDQSSKTEKTFFANYLEKYTNMFAELNDEINELSKINTHIESITNDSEEMELIALNAMVVSIKSGEKGRAFSCITENLQRLSSEMIKLSGKLTNEETTLLDSINTLKALFQQITDCQQKIASISTTQVNRVAECISMSANPLQEIITLSQSVYPYIQSAMEGLQMQDIIKQAFNHVIMSLNEFVDDETILEPSEKLDAIAFNMSLAELVRDVLRDIGNDLKKSTEIFDEKWQQVKLVLDKTDKERDEYLATFFKSDDNTGRISIAEQLDNTNEDISLMNAEFANFQSAQKRVVSICRGITDKARSMYDVFISLRPVISRLQHVRILQEIEVSKNDAITTVKDFVTDMDKLILNSTNSLDIMQATIDLFIEEIGVMVLKFSSTIAEDNSNMAEVKSEKSLFCESLNSIQEKISLIMKNFTVYPPEFHFQCQTVNDLLNRLAGIQNSFNDMISLLDNEILRFSEKKENFMKEMGLSNYEIKDDRFKELISNFTITAHKQAAGKIVGFDVEEGFSPGDVTFF